VDSLSILFFFKQIFPAYISLAKFFFKWRRFLFANPVLQIGKYTRWFNMYNKTSLDLFGIWCVVYTELGVFLTSFLFVFLNEIMHIYSSFTHDHINFTGQKKRIKLIASITLYTIMALSNCQVHKQTNKKFVKWKQVVISQRPKPCWLDCCGMKRHKHW